MPKTIKTKESCLKNTAPKTKEALGAIRRSVVKTRQNTRNVNERDGGESAESGAASQMTDGMLEASARSAALGKRAARGASEKMAREAKATPQGEAASAASAKANLSGTASPRGGRSGKAARRTGKGQAHYIGDAARKRAVRTARLRIASKAAAANGAVPAKAKGVRRLTRSAKDGALAFARMAARALRSMQAALAAIGGAGAAVVVIICIVGLIATSAFGIFFAGGDMGDGNPSLREEVARIDAAHAKKIEDLKAENLHDEVALSGSRASWADVLAVFSVRCAHDPDNPMDVLTLDVARQALLEDTFWAMNSVEASVEEREVIEIAVAEGEDGTSVETQQSVTRKVLRITLVRMDADEAAERWAFNAEQRDILSQLIDSSNAKLWQTVLHGAAGSGDIVETALSQVGNVGGSPYWSWYGFSSRVEWCACFVSWCANECGYIEAGAVPKFSYCPTGVQWFRDAGLWLPCGSEPAPGDIVFFDWNGDGISDHVGIVESCDDSTVRTVEGNSSDGCRQRSYGVGSSSIMGYGIPMY